MPSDSTQTGWQNPAVLRDAAQGLRETEATIPGVVEQALLRAHRRVVDELAVMATHQAAGEAIDVQELFATQPQMKRAALLVLARYILLDLAHFPRTVLDIDLAHQHLALCVEALFRLGAVDGLMLLYDFAQEQHRTHKHPRFWENVRSHCLMLLALMEEDRPWVVHFLSERPSAREQLARQVSFTRPEVIGSLLKDATASAAAPPPAAPPDYVSLFERYDPHLSSEEALGYCSFLQAERRIVRALESDDLAEAMRWFVEGSDAAARAVLRHARATLPRRTQRHLLEAVLNQENAPPVRRAAVVLELDAINREEKPEGGTSGINRLLFETAMDARKEQAGVARLAVDTLRMVKNLDALLLIIEDTPQQPVAEEAITAMKALRRLLMVEPLLSRRPKLQPAYQAAHAELVEIQKIMDDVWTCDQPDQIAAHVTRLRALNATPELNTIAELAERRGDLHHLRLPLQ